MKYPRMLGLLAIAVAALTALAGTASASSNLTSPTGTTYTGEFVATAENFQWHGPFVTVQCGHAAFKGQVEKHTMTNAGGTLSSWTITQCNFETTVVKRGSLEVDTNGKVLSSGAEISIKTSIGTCVFTTSKTPLGNLKDSHETGGKAWLYVAGNIPRTGGNWLCGSSATWTGTYIFTTPNTLYVD